VHLHVEYAERGKEYGILFIFSLFCEYIHLEYVRIHVIYRVDQTEYGIHILVVALQEYVNIYSTRRVVHPRVWLEVCLRPRETPLHRRFIIQRGHEHTRTGNWSESGFGSLRGALWNISRCLGGESTPRPQWPPATTCARVVVQG